MRSREPLSLTLGFLLLAVSPPAPTDLSNGIWAGTMTVAGASTYFTVAFPHADAADDPQGDVYFPRQSEVGFPLSRVTARDGSVSFEVPRAVDGLSFSGTKSERSITGTVSEGARRGTFVLQHLIRLSPEVLEPYTGTYRAGDREIGIARPYTYLMFLDKKTGRMGFLWPMGRDEFFSGPSKGIHYPAAAIVHFERGADGEVKALSFRYGDGASIKADRLPPFASRELDFTSGDAAIRGTIFLPAAKPPFPAVLLLAGSNYQTRSAQNALLTWVGDVFLRHGFAVYAYDKRGAGFSTGVRDDSHTVDDAIRGFQTLAAQPEIDRRCAGIWGISQGGMAAPKVAATVPNVAFIVNTSGATVNANLQEIQRTALEMRADGFSDADVRNAVALQTLKFHYASTGEGWDEYAAALTQYRDRAWFPDPYIGPPDDRKSTAFAFWKAAGADAPADYWSLYHGPVLYIDGQHETNQDPAENIAAFKQAMKTAGNSSYTVIVVEGADHSMLVDARGGNKVDRLLDRYALAYFHDLAQWIDTIPCAR